MGGSSSGLSSLDTRTTLGAAAPRRAAVRALRTGAGPLRRRSARFPRPRNRCVRLDHWVDTARPGPGKRNTGRSKYAGSAAGRHPSALWTAPAPCHLDGARLRRILDRPTRKTLHPAVKAALPPPRPIASGQATTYWGRQIAYPNAQFPTPMPGPGTDGVHPAQQRPPRDAEEDRKRGGGRPRTPGAGSTRQEQATRSWGWGQTRLSRLFVFYGSGAPRRGTCTDPAAPATRGSAPVACLEVQNASEFQARTGAGRAHGPKCV